MALFKQAYCLEKMQNHLSIEELPIDNKKPYSHHVRE
jgi:hypothetical protein